MQQLLFSALPKIQYNFHSFYVFDNKMLAIVNLLKSFCSQDQHNAVYLYGDRNYGKTHLLNATFLIHKDNSIFIDLNDKSLSCEMLYELNDCLICLDNIDKVLGDREWEEAIFYLYNNMIFGNNYLLFSSLNSPNQLNFILADLRSRLNQTLVLPLIKLSDEQKIIAVNYLMKSNNINIPSSIIEYIFKTYSRDLKNVISYLIYFSNLALKQQKKLNLSFIRSQKQKDIEIF